MQPNLESDDESDPLAAESLSASVVAAGRLGDRLVAGDAGLPFPGRFRTDRYHLVQYQQLLAFLLHCEKHARHPIADIPFVCCHVLQ